MEKIIYLKDFGGDKMNKTIWESINFNPNKRPAYTKYEIAKAVYNKREELGMTKEKFAEKYNTNVSIIDIIENVSRNFNIAILRICSNILGKPLSELVRFDEEDLEKSVSYRTNNSEYDQKAQEVVEIANNLFNEFVMQHKINA